MRGTRRGWAGEVSTERWAATECSRALTLKRTLWSDGALQLLEHAIALDAACDDDGRGEAQPLVREVNLLDRLCARKLVNLKRVQVDSAKGGGMR